MNFPKHNLHMKIITFIASSILALALFNTCKKEESVNINKDQKSNYFFEQAFPGQHGELQTYILAYRLLAIPIIAIRLAALSIGPKIVIYGLDAVCSTASPVP